MGSFAEREQGQAGIREVTRTLSPIESDIRQLFFPGQDVKAMPVNQRSSSVQHIKTPHGDYISKCLDATPYHKRVLETEREWVDRIGKTRGITAPEFIPANTGEYFPIAPSSDNTIISVMPKLAFEPFELTNYQDYERMGEAIALLHKAAPDEMHSGIRRFVFSETNPFVESFWGLLNTEELSLFKKILTRTDDLDSLPSQITHNDVHPENLMSYHGTPLFIDFDQMLTGPRINDLGQALSAFWLDESLEGFELAMQSLIKGYNTVSPLSQKEIHALPMFALRKACISFTWFKGLLHNGESGAGEWYRKILARAHIIDSYLEKYGYYAKDGSGRS